MVIWLICVMMGILGGRKMRSKLTVMRSGIGMFLISSSHFRIWRKHIGQLSNIHQEEGEDVILHITPIHIPISLVFLSTGSIVSNVIPVIHHQLTNWIYMHVELIQLFELVIGLWKEFQSVSIDDELLSIL